MAPKLLLLFTAIGLSVQLSLTNRPMPLPKHQALGLESDTLIFSSSSSLVLARQDLRADRRWVHRQGLVRPKEGLKNLDEPEPHPSSFI